MSKNFVFRGDLGKTTLPEMLFAINRFQVPGIIEARQGETVKRVYIRDGNVLHASSSDIDDSLGTFLRRTGRLTEEQFDRTMRERQESSQRYGAILVEQRILSPAEVYATIRQQVEAIVWSLFYWRDGEVSFQIGDFRATGMVRIMLPMQQVILAGIKRAPDAKQLVGRLGRKETLFEPCYSVEDLVDLALDADEYAVLRRVDGERTLYAICTGGPLSAADTAKLVYAFHVLGLIKSADQAPQRQEAEGRSEKIRIRFRTEGDLHNTTS